MTKCPNNCGNAATLHPTYGITLCTSCKQKPYRRPNISVEFTSEDIKRQRKDYSTDIIQPYRKGELSKEYIEKYGTKRLKVTPEEIKNAKNVWNGSDIGGYYNK